MSVHFPESLSLASTLAEQCVCHERLWIRVIGQRPPETNPITIKPKTASHTAEQFAWVPLPYCSPPGCPFPIKSLALSAHVSPQTIHFRVLDKSPVSGPGRGPPFLQQLDHNEAWAPKNWCFRNVLLEKTLESPLESKEIQPVHPKGNQSWIFTGRTVAEAEILILWPPDAKSWLTGKDPNAGKDWRQVEKGWQRMRRVDGIINSRGMNLSKLIHFFFQFDRTCLFLYPYVCSLGIIWFPRRLTEIAPSWSGKIITTCLSCLTTVGPDKACRKLPRRMCEEPQGGRRHQSTICLVTLTWKNFRGAKRKNEEMICPADLPEIFTLESSKMTGQRQPGKLTSLL